MGSRSARWAVSRVLAIATLLLAGCGGDAGTGGEGGGTVIVGMRSDFSGINPVTNSSYYTTQIINYGLFTPLIQYDADLEPEPWLAESWELHGDTGVTFRLRSDVTWHDGQPVTAHDVLFTFELAKDPETASLLGTAFLADVASASVADDHTISFRFARPHAQALEDFWWPPLPRHLLQDVPALELTNAPFNRQPVGSGPFRFGEWRANERLVLVRNPDFPAALGGPAAPERLVFRIVPEAGTLLTELFTGGVHVDIPVLPEQVAQIESNSSATLLSFPGTTVYFIGWNNEKPPFNDARVRLAMAHAIDREEIIQALLHGQGEIATSTIPPWSPVHPGDVRPPAFDRARAGQLLDEAGWTDRNGDGIRENAAGRPLTFTMMSSDDPLRRAVVEVLQNQLRQAGANVDVRVMEFQTMLAAHKERNYDAVFTNWVLDNFQVAGSAFSLFHSSQADVPLSTNRSGTRSPALDRLIERGARATDPDAQRAAWREFTELVQREQPVTFMFWLAELAAVRDEVQGVEMDPRGELRTMARWTVSR
ncbi:MAG TPA: ABC transporter substrate-binding protein [Longimicrobiales bacterium]|nr:ABC transporter substrate-binding protein [Longimicrobiales bacterium]